MMQGLLKKTAALGLSAVLMGGLYISSGKPVFASDLSGHWAEKTITELQKQNLIQGYKDGTFKPEMAITRAEFVSAVNRVLMLETGEGAKFTDVKDTDWYAKDVSIASAKGYCKGYSDGTFRAEQPITRAEASVMLARALDLKDAEKQPAFTDLAELPAWAQKEIAAMSSQMLISGYPDGSFQPNKDIKRAEAFSILGKIAENKKAAENAVTEHLTVQKDGEQVKGKTVAGNLTVSEKVGEGTVKIENTTVKGNLIVKGGGKHSVFLDNVTVGGKIIVEKDARLVFGGNTKAEHVEVNKPCLFEAEKFTGSVKQIEITKSAGSAAPVQIGIPAESVKLKAAARLEVSAKVSTVEITKEAKGSSVNVSKTGEIGNLHAAAKSEIKGNGRIANITVTAEDVKIDSALKNKASVTDKTKKQTSENSSKDSSDKSNGGGNGSSESNTPSVVDVTGIELTGGGNFTSDDEEKTITVSYTPSNTTKRAVKWEIKQGENTVEIVSQTENSLTLKALRNGDYILQATIKEKPGVYKVTSGTVKNQKVGLESGSKGTAGDKTITGLEAKKLYILQCGASYIAVRGTGAAGNVFTTQNEATAHTESLKDGVTAITGLDNAKTYHVIEVEANTLFDKQLEQYLAYSENDITLKNVTEIEKLGDLLLEQIGNMLTSDPSNQELKDKKQSVEEKKEALKNKLNEVKNSLTQLKQELQSDLDSIKEDLEYNKDTLDALIKKIEENMEKLSEEDKTTFNISYAKVAKLKDDMKRAERYNGATLTLKEDGSLTLSGGNDEIYIVVLYQGTEVKENYRVSKGEVPNLLKDMKKHGSGKYKAKAKINRYNFLKLETEFTSNEVEIQ